MGDRRRTTRGQGPARVAVVLGALAAGALLPSSALATSELVVRGAGFGHGVGMSQWGAYGMARHGSDARTILAHYYTGTGLSKLTSSPSVRVALQWGRRDATVSGASEIGGLAVRADRSYELVRDGAGVAIRLVGAGARQIGKAPAGVRVVSSGGTLRVAGSAADGVQDGSFRGRIDVVPDGSGVVVVNELDLEDYLRGVVTEESPASWPSAALQAQAIAARTYAITSPIGGQPFTQWPDTRSQVYTGISGETAAGDAAVEATAGEVVTVDRRPVTTYFFSSSGGRTEDARNVFPDPKVRSWLRSVPDPYDDAAPLHRWTRRFSLADATRRVGSLGVGSLEQVAVLRRGDSPRIVRARVVGSSGSRTVDGGTIQQAFDLPERWATFAVVSISGCRRPVAGHAGAADAGDAPAGSSTVAADDPAGGALALADRGARDIAAALARAAPAREAAGASGCRFVGGLVPAPAGATAQLQEQQAGGWTDVRPVVLDGDGRFDVSVPRGGRWRVSADGFATPAADARR